MNIKAVYESRLNKLLLLLIIIFLGCNSTSEVNTELIKGNWVNEEKYDGAFGIGIEGIRYDTLSFMDNGKVWSSREGENFNYKLKGEVLFIEKAQHYIVKLTQDSLVLEYHFRNSNGWTNYTRIKNTDFQQ